MVGLPVTEETDISGARTYMSTAPGDTGFVGPKWSEWEQGRLVVRSSEASDYPHARPHQAYIAQMLVSLPLCLGEGGSCSPKAIFGKGVT